MSSRGSRMSRRAWRRAVASRIVDRVDNEGDLLFVGNGYEDRREMLRIAELFPPDVIAELYEDRQYPGYTFLEVRLIQAPIAYAPRDDDQDWNGREYAV